MLQSSRNANITEVVDNTFSDHEQLVIDVVEKAQSRFIVHFSKSKTIQFRSFENQILHEFETWQDAGDFLNI